MSFTRADYQTVFLYALDRWRHAKRRGEFNAMTTSERIMAMCEEVIGQQSERPPESRLRQHAIEQRVRTGQGRAKLKRVK